MYGYLKPTLQAKKQKVVEDYNLVSAVVLFGSNETGATGTMCNAEKLYRVEYTNLVVANDELDEDTSLKVTAQEMMQVFGVTDYECQRNEFYPEVEWA